MLPPQAPPAPIDHVSITADRISLDPLLLLVRDGQDGAIATFTGTTRDHFVVDGVRKRVLRLEYEAYEPMAHKALLELLAQARQRWPEITHQAIVHRIGVVPVAEASVIIVVTSPHRQEALAACSWLIDELKATVPIWKKEFYEDGSTWKANSECLGCRRSAVQTDSSPLDAGLPPRSALALFIEHVAPQMAVVDPGSSAAEQYQAVLLKWKGLTGAERQQWSERAVEDERRWERQLGEYHIC
ncbi:Molybdopterin biosynthesis MoaE [Polychytrium aggregatum]|uniref:Molybdopterin biosynthesis MoaE n=1 Tax=Polychytrium aggregatum TaxID=110093 RepID=UPI0022FE0A95|nr:Molybdopterin biosynthesis MoaE [Polychytrium aggregatum]KAI9206748.1 Molybdopterin biosynthesis MoaE [Polychytrium aggregatum]